MNNAGYIPKQLRIRAKRLCRVMFSVSGVDPMEESRKRPVVYARMMVAYALLREGNTEHSVGTVLGWDHSTINYYRSAMDDILSSPGYAKERELWDTFIKTSKYMEKTLIVIPYLASGAQGNELELAVTGWRKHFKEPYQIVLVGDYHPIVESGDDIAFIKCPHIDTVCGQYMPALDHVHKFRTVRKFYPKTEGFVYTCDDIYAVADITLADIKVPKYPEIATKWLEPKDWSGKIVDWYDARGNTAAICRREGLPVRDWVCHMPVYFEWDKFIEILDKYDADHNSIVPENIYFSMYADVNGAEDARNWRDEVHGSNPNLRPLGTVKWVTNQNSGWSPKLEEILRKHYGI